MVVTNQESTQNGFNDFKMNFLAQVGVIPAEATTRSCSQTLSRNNSKEFHFKVKFV